MASPHGLSRRGVRDSSANRRRVAVRLTAPFTGLKPAGSVDPIILGTDRALETGDGDSLANDIANSVREGIQLRFADAYAKGQFADQSVEQGREYVEAYVELTHFVVSTNHLVAEGPSHQHIETLASDQ